MLRRPALTVLALLAGVLVPVPAVQAAPAELPSEIAALAAAKRFGKPVEVAGLRSETTEVIANPSGTLTAKINTQPVRMRVNGEWRAIDTTLRRTDKGIEPVAVPKATRLSAGGDGPLYTVGATLLNAPAKLPEPVLSGDTATYRDVRPGVDLIAKVGPEGVSTTYVPNSPDGEKALTSGEATVMIAPPGTDIGPANWTMINERHVTTPYWTRDRDQGAKVGYVEDANDGWERYRSIFTFQLGQFRGKHILRSWFSSYIKHTYSCSASWTDLYVVNAVDSGTTWQNHAGSWNRYLAGVNNSDCRDTGVYSEWNNDNVAAAARDGANSGTLTLGLRANGDGERFINTAWKKFDEKRTVLTVEYNSIPEVPDQLSVEGKPCNGQTQYVGTPTPTLRARPRDADGHVHKVWFGYGERWSPGGEFKSWNWVNVPNIPSGATAPHKVPQTLAEGAPHAFHSQSEDPWDTGGKSAFCEFVVDLTKPAPPVIRTEDGRYPSDEQIHGGVGISGAFTFTGADADVVGYYYGVASPPADFVPANALGGAATAGVTPEWRGSNAVYVQAVDRAGNRSEVARYDFKAGSGLPPAGVWKLDEKSGTAFHSSVGQWDGTVHNGTFGSAGRIYDGPTALSLTGAQDSEAVISSVINTAESFSVSAWVKKTVQGGTATAVAHEGTRVGGFALGYDAGRWAFSMPQSDTDNAPVTLVTAPDEPRMRVWTHLAGAYDAATHKLSLYVNGRLVGEKIAPNEPWTAARWLVIGRNKWNGVNAQNWAGEIADVQVWNRRIYLSEVTELANQLTMVGQYTFDEPSGNTMTDTSDFHHDVTFGSGQWQRTTRVSGGALNANGSFGATTGPVVRTTTGFAVSAWVRMDQKSTSWQAAVTQDGDRTSPFGLQYAADRNKWAFAVMDSDKDVPPEYRTFSQNEVALGQWTHLVGVYDPGAKQVRLYVNGQLESTASAPMTFESVKPLVIGRGRWVGQNYDFFSGGIDDVRVFAGVPTDLDVAALYQN